MVERVLGIRLKRQGNLEDEGVVALP